MNAPLPMNSPGFACLETCSGLTQNVLVVTMPFFQARENEQVALAVSCKVGWPIFLPGWLLALTTKNGEPAMSVWNTRSSDSVCFLMMTSLEVASLPPMTKNPSLLKNQRNFSYH